MTTIQPLSNIEIMEKTNCNFIKYSDMPQINSILELLKDDKPCLIIYEIAEIGHFCCIFMDGENNINFFDPLSGYPDQVLNGNDHYKEHHDFTYLLELFGKYSTQMNRPIIYSEHIYQKRGNSNVCGHWCTIRMLTSTSLNNEKFYKLMKKYNIVKNDKKIAKLYSTL